MARNPEVILDMGDMSDTVGITEQHKREVVALWDRVTTVDAVKHHRVLAIASDMYMVPGPRVVDAARSIFDMLHPGNPNELRVLRAGFAYGLREVTFELPVPAWWRSPARMAPENRHCSASWPACGHPYSGSCVYRDTEVSRWSRRDFARRVAFLPQMLRFEFPFTAEQVVFMGRTPYGGGWFESPADHEADRAGDGDHRHARVSRRAISGRFQEANGSG